jgi:nucleotidyltransferase/DNA polymerase involved in DNA repair
MSPVARSPATWPRAIALMDMNTFFASVEQHEHSEWRGRPVAIMEALQDITPDIEVFSVDEAFLDVTHCQRLLGSPSRIEPELAEAIHNRWPRIMGNRGERAQWGKGTTAAPTTLAM